MSGFAPVRGGVPGQRIVATTDVPARRAAAQVHPPAAVGVAFNATRAGGWNRGVDRCAHAREPTGARCTAEQGVDLGDRTEAAIKTETVLGTKFLELTPRGDGNLNGPIPIERTTSPYDLPTALGDLTTTISALDTTQLSSALTTLAETFKDTPPDLKIALEGVARFSDTLNTCDALLRNLLANANKVTAVLAKRSDQIAGLVANANALLAELLSQRNSVDAHLGNQTWQSMLVPPTPPLSAPLSSRAALLEIALRVVARARFHSLGCNLDDGTALARHACR